MYSFYLCSVSSCLILIILIYTTWLVVFKCHQAAHLGLFVMSGDQLWYRYDTNILTAALFGVCVYCVSPSNMMGMEGKFPRVVCEKLWLYVRKDDLVLRHCWHMRLMSSKHGWSLNLKTNVPNACHLPTVRMDSPWYHQMNQDGANCRGVSRDTTVVVFSIFMWSRCVSNCYHQEQFQHVYLCLHEKTDLSCCCC